jgi:hypothetical protein
MRVILPRYSAALLLFVGMAVSLWANAQPNGYIQKDGATLFPLGFYELPKEDTALKAMADAGVNLVQCASREDLDRVQAVGMLGIIRLPLQGGATEALEKSIAAVSDHPALAVWEGPDEIVWTFTAYSALHRTMGVHKTPGEWDRQTPEALAYAEKMAAEIIPNMRAAANVLRKIAPEKPLWINEARNSDVFYVRQCLDFIDITGCDVYPVKADKKPIAVIGATTERWKALGRGKPVWMVLQAFSWNELGDYYGATDVAYPSFAESRFMAYDAIVHGAKGILYWGSEQVKSETFRESIYAVTRELAALQPFLVADDVPGVRIEVIEARDEPAGRNVAAAVRRNGDDWLIAVVNEDPVAHLGVVIGGIEAVEDRTMNLLYGDETQTVDQGEIVTRLQPFEVKVYTTGKMAEANLAGRDFQSAPR